MAKDKEKFFKNAQKFIQRGNLDKAIGELEKALAIDKKDSRILIKLGDLCRRKKDDAKAVEYYQKAAKELTKSGFYSRAIAVYRQIVQIDDSNLQILTELADLYIKLGLNSEAMAQLQKIASNLEHEARLTEALEVVQKMVELDPRNPVLMTKLAELYYKNGNKEKGYQVYRQVLDYLQEEGRYEQYLKMLEKLAKADPENIENLKELAQIYFEHEQWDRAYAVLARIHQNEPEDTEILNQLSTAALKAGRPDDAVKFLKTLAGIYKEKGLRQRFKDALRRVLEIHPDDPQALAVVGKSEPLLQKEEPPEEIEEVIEGPLEVLEEADTEEEVIIETAAPIEEEEEEAEAASLTPEQIQEHLTEAGVYLKYGLRDKALHHVRIVLKADPQNLKAHAYMKDIYLEAGETSKAVNELETLAVAGLEQNKPEVAKNAVEEWLNLDPENKKAKELAARVEAALAQAPSAEAPPAPEEEVIEAEEEIEMPEEAEEAAAEEVEAEEVVLEEEEEEAPLAEPVEAPPSEPEPAQQAPSEVEEEIVAEEAEEEVVAEEAELEEEITEEEEEIAEEAELPEVEHEIPGEPAAPPVPEEAAPGEAVPEEVSIEEVEETPSQEPAPPPASPASQPAPAKIDFSEELEEADFYLQQGLPEEAKKIYLEILKQDPTNQEALSRLNEMEEAEPEEVVITEEEAEIPFAEQEPPQAEVSRPEASTPAESEPAPPAEQPIVPEPPVETAPEPEAASPGQESEEPAIPEGVEVEPVAEEEPAPEPEAAPAPFAASEPEIPEAAAEPEPVQDVPEPESPEPAALKEEQSAVPEAPPPPPAPVPEAQAREAGGTGFDLKAEIQDALGEKDEFFVGPAPPPGEDLFAPSEGEEEGLFDLAAELEKDLEWETSSKVGAFESAAEEFSFEETLKAFKKGVAQTISEHDSATHFDLGIAYKEMGLLDDAIQEFMIASRDPHRYFECLLMTSLILREKGEFDKAVETCKTALTTPEADDKNRASFFYELAEVFLAAGEKEKAKWCLEQAKALDPSLPQLEERLQELADVNTIPVNLEEEQQQPPAAETAPQEMDEEDLILERALSPHEETPQAPARESSPSPEQAQPQDAGPPPSREKTTWQKAALEQPGQEEASAKPQPEKKKKTKKISYV